MGTFEDNIQKSVSRAPDTRVFQKEASSAYSPEKEISYVPPKFVTKTLAEHGITYDPRKHVVYTAAGSTKFFLETKGNAALLPFESQKVEKSTLEEQFKPIMENLNQPPQTPEPIPNLEALAKQWEEAVKKESGETPDTAKIVGEPFPPQVPPHQMEAPVVAETAPTKELQPERTLESRLTEGEQSLSTEQKKTYDTLTAWWNTLPESWKPVITHTLIKGAHNPQPSPAPTPGAVPGPQVTMEPSPLTNPTITKAEVTTPSPETSPNPVEAFKAAEMNLALDFIEKRYTEYSTLPAHYQQAGALIARHITGSVV